MSHDDSTREVSPTSVVDQPNTSPPSGQIQRLDQCYEAFLRDLPELLQNYPGRWVVYAGSVRLGVGPTKRGLYQDCLKAGHLDGEFLICSIEPPQEVVLDELPDV